jgi:hypothetical protein
VNLLAELDSLAKRAPNPPSAEARGAVIAMAPLLVAEGLLPDNLKGNGCGAAALTWQRGDGSSRRYVLLLVHADAALYLVRNKPTGTHGEIVGTGRHTEDLVGAVAAVKEHLAS